MLSVCRVGIRRSVPYLTREVDALTLQNSPQKALICGLEDGIEFVGFSEDNDLHIYIRSTQD